MDTIDIGFGQLALGALLLAVNLGLSVALRLGLAKDLVIGAARMTVQLLLVGLVLDWVFASENAWLILGIATVMAALAGRAAVNRTVRRYPGILWNALVVILGASFLVTGATVLGILRVEPWFDPQYLIPLHGMLLGNALNGISLGLDRFMEGCAKDRPLIETRLALGATRWEAARPVAKEAIRTGMIPVVNSMMIMGLVSLPGMMTGQILAGADPAQAVRYQILIMFMIASCVALATGGVVALAYRALFSPRHQLRSEKLRRA
ncbi:ABC transporter permease [Rubricoccus marinus]|uniref:Iron export ABC transporter permease subunit FetB n=1 Tax=Rubricoccus marinus TaxID=716817 RepID=A0A259TXT1_9BACT|nr:iron export ABC transporter permease subunit FetB [Rubricoccus marinus]OZC02384.1 iron export ABC transporter permease subunit FetB [Rubricoccus marinus]